MIFGNNWIWINTKCSKLTTLRKFITIQKRLELQVKLHRIIIKVHKIISFTHTKILTPAKNFMDPQKPFQSLNTSPSNPRTHNTHAIHIIYQTWQINVNRKDHASTTAVLHHRYFPWKYWRYCIDFSSWWLPKLPQQTKKIFRTGNIVKKYFRNSCRFDVSIIIFRCTAWLENLEKVAPRAFMKKVLLKIS